MEVQVPNHVLVVAGTRGVVSPLVALFVSSNVLDCAVCGFDVSIAVHIEELISAVGAEVHVVSIFVVQLLVSFDVHLPDGSLFVYVPLVSIGRVVSVGGVSVVFVFQEGAISLITKDEPVILVHVALHSSLLIDSPVVASLVHNLDEGACLIKPDVLPVFCVVVGHVAILVLGPLVALGVDDHCVAVRLVEGELGFVLEVGVGDCLLYVGGVDEGEGGLEV